MAAIDPNQCIHVGTYSVLDFFLKAKVGGWCVCNKCGYKCPVAEDIPCSSKKCPKCNIPLEGTPVIREGKT